MKYLGVMVSLFLAVMLSACGGSDSDDAEPGGSGGTGGNEQSGYAQPEGPAPDLAALEGGTTPLEPANGSAFPDACSVLTDEMVLKLLPAAGQDGEAGVQRSSKDQNDTAYTCQYFSGTSDDKNVGFIIVSYLQTEGIDREVMLSTFEDSIAANQGKENFVDYGEDLGAGSLAFYDGSRVNVLVGATQFSVQASGTEPSQDDPILWRDNVMVPVAENITSRMQ
jgi:hypothetical protein